MARHWDERLFRRGPGEVNDEAVLEIVERAHSLLDGLPAPDLDEAIAAARQRDEVEP